MGIGQTEYSSDSGRSETQLALEASLDALSDAGLDPHEIDGVVPFVHGPSTEDVVAGLGLPDVKFTAVPHLGGAGAVVGIGHAAMAVEAGLASTVLCFVARNGRTVSRVHDRVRSIVPGQRFRNGLERPHGLSSPAQWYSLMCRRHMKEFGTTREQLGRVAITMRDHAQQNPNAQMFGRPLSMEDYLASRPIADPYLLFDCCLETDGACAVIVRKASGAGAPKVKPVQILAIAEGHPDSPDDIANRPDIFHTGLSKAAPRALAQAQVSRTDIDVLMVYDCFTFEVIQQLEEAGFCGRGEGGSFIEDGHIARSGSLPVNTHGGLLSEGHLAGMNHILEAVRQLRGAAGERQLANVSVAAVTGWGDFGDGSMAILSA